MPKNLRLPACAAVVLGAFTVALHLHLGGAHVARGVDDIGQLGAAAAAAAGGLWRARRAHGRLRVSWALIGLGAAAWAVGEVIWSYYELVAGRETPFPSFADAGYLLFPALALPGILVRPSRAFRGQGRVRIALDATLVVASLFLISWATALGEVYRGGGDSALATVVGLAYPAADLLLLTVVVIVLAYARAGSREGLVWVATGLIAFSVADSGFAYLTSIGTYHTGSLVDIGWFAGFLVLACGAVADRLTTEPSAGVDLPPRGALLLPYLPAMGGLVAVVWSVRHGTIDAAVSVAASLLTAMLITRQIVVLLENRRLIASISHQAFHDALTGLANRALFDDRLSHALELHRRDLRPVTVLLIDLDDFKTVNDSLGHPAGDELLMRVSERLRAVLRTGDTVARLGGDEFAVLMEDGGDAIELAVRILASLDQAVVVDTHAVPVGASIGVATLRPEDPPASSADMLKRADLAMYAAKRAGKSTVCEYSGDMEQDAAGELDLKAAFATALAAEQIDVAFQPILHADGRLGGFEALARWTHDGVAVPPATFIPIATRLGVIAQLDDLVMRKAVAEAVMWGRGLVLSVNFDGQTLSDPYLADRVLAVLAAAGLPPQSLAVEVLETSLVEYDEAALVSLRRLREVGVRVVVDDFGAGYASLVRLQALEPDVVKIDRSLVAMHGQSDRSAPLLSGVAQLAHQMGALVVAEGVETQHQLSAAIAAGCDAVQGYLLGRPTTAEHCRELVRQSDELTPPSTVGG